MNKDEIMTEAKMNIQFVGLHRQYMGIKGEIDSAIEKVMTKGDFILGEKVHEFELNFAEYCGVQYCITCANGTDAIELALRALGVSRGDKVIVPNNTFISDAVAVSAIGAEVVLCDVNEATQLIDTDTLRSLWSDAKAIIPVNLFGQLVDDSVFRVARFYGLKIVEDCAQSVGASISGTRKLRGDIGTYSFYPAKNLGCAGDGGCCVSNTELHDIDLRSLRNIGSMVKYYHDEIGRNSRLDTIQASILDVKLKHLDEWNKHRVWAAKNYDERLKGVGDIRITKTEEGSVYHLYVIRTKKRDELQQHLKKEGINTQIHYPITIGKQRAYYQFNHLSFPISEQLANENLSLPIHQSLTLEQIEYVCDTIKSFYSN